MADVKISQIIPEQWADQLLRAEPGGTKSQLFALPKCTPKMKVNADFRYQIAFEQFRIAKSNRFIPSLMVLRNHVTKTIKLFKGGVRLNQAPPHGAELRQAAGTAAAEA